jgi:uncharacterized protein
MAAPRSVPHAETESEILPIVSRENVELAQKGFEAFSRRDLDTALALMHPEIEAHDPPEVPDATVYRGLEAVRLDWERTFELFEDFSIEVEKVFESGDEVVLYLRYRGKGRESGAEVEAHMAHVWTFQDGKAIRLRQYLDRAKALEEAGLTEESASEP